LEAILMNRKNPWLVFLLPFVVYMLAGSFEPSPPKPEEAKNWLSIRYEYYPIIYSVKIGLTLATMFFVLPGYRAFSAKGPEGNITPKEPVRFSKLLAVSVGLVGILLWIALCKLNEMIGLSELINLGARASFNPLEHLKNQPLWAWTFLAIRFIGLALVVPVIEEFFLRGFVMRFVMEKDWWKVPFGTANRLAIVLGTAVPLLSHPAELLAAAVWFSLVTWLMLRTKNIWDCVIAHAVTNLLLGVYVVVMGGDAWRMM
jgi:uncharacterized protein